VSRITDMVKRHEGTVKNTEDMHVVYDDATGKPIKKGDKITGIPTIGWGQNLVDLGLNDYICEQLLQMVITNTHYALKQRFPIYERLDRIRQEALIDMAFNLGIAGIGKFKKMWVALAAGDYERAGVEMMDSLWARQVGPRANELEEMIVTGRYT